MTPKEQAQDLVDKYTNILTPILGKHVDSVEIIEAAKECALVDIQNTIDEAKRWHSSYMGNERLNHLLKVKEEIEKLCIQKNH